MNIVAELDIFIYLDTIIIIFHKYFLLEKNMFINILLDLGV